MNDDELEQGDPATAALSRLEGEVALVRRAVQQLAAEKAEIRIPDYSITLGELSKSLESAEQTLREIAAKPAMELTPENMARRIDRVAQEARQSNEEWMRKAQDRYNDVIRDLLGVTATLRAAHEQRLHLIWAASGGVVAGCLFWSILPGASRPLAATRANGYPYRRCANDMGGWRPAHAGRQSGSDGRFSLRPRCGATIGRRLPPAREKP